MSIVEIVAICVGLAALAFFGAQSVIKKGSAGAGQRKAVAELAAALITMEQFEQLFDKALDAKVQTPEGRKAVEAKLAVAEPEKINE